MAIKREWKKVITFPTTTCAMEAERLCKLKTLPGRLIPVPTSISAGCGMALSTSIDSADAIIALFNENNLTFEGIFELEL
jgi:hypothetical protein